jgi:hypothetical protein
MMFITKGIGAPGDVGHFILKGLTPPNWTGGAITGPIEVTFSFVSYVTRSRVFASNGRNRG